MISTSGRDALARILADTPGISANKAAKALADQGYKVRRQDVLTQVRELLGRAVRTDQQRIGQRGGRVSTFVRQSPTVRSLPKAERQALTNIVKDYEAFGDRLNKEQQLDLDTALADRDAAMFGTRGPTRKKIRYEAWLRLQEIEGAYAFDWDEAAKMDFEDDMTEYLTEASMRDPGTASQAVNELYQFYLSRYY